MKNKRKEDNGLKIKGEREQMENEDLGEGEKKLHRKREEEKCVRLF